MPAKHRSDAEVQTMEGDTDSSEHARTRAGGNTDWEAPPASRADGVAESGDVAHRFQRYLDTVAAFLPASHAAAPGSAVSVVQARHDRFVPFCGGQQLIQQLANRCLSEDCDVSDVSCTFRSVAGGHVTGFVSAKHLMVPAVLDALGRLADVQPLSPS